MHGPARSSLVLVAALSIPLVACGPTPRTTAVARAPAPIDLATTSSDAWTRARTLRGTADPDCSALTLACTSPGGACGGELTRDGARFSAEVALAIGPNTIVVRCALGEHVIASEPIVWTVPEILRHELPSGAPLPPARAAWIGDAVVYGAVPQLFAAEDGLRAVEGRLDLLRALGVDTLWLSPIHPSPDGDYGYAVLDPFSVRAEIGGEDALRSLVAAAHARAMRVLLDMVPNHLSSEHPYFVHAQRHGERSPYYRYFDRDERGEPTHYFDWEHLPNLDYETGEVRTMMAAAFAHWARDLDVDGFRIDAAWGVRQRTPAFFRELAPMLYAIDPELLLVAEASARDPYWREIGFAAAYDWTDEVGHWAWREAFASDEEGAPIDAAALRDALAVEPALTPFRFLDNNDTGPRFRTRHGRAAYDAASAMLFALPGIPALFTGDEDAAEYSPYELEEPLETREDPDARAALARRIAVRREHRSALEAGALVLVPAEPGSVIAFERRGEGETLLVVIQLAGTATVARVASELAPARDLLSGAPVRARARRGALEIPMPPWGARVLAR